MTQRNYLNFMTQRNYLNFMTQRNYLNFMTQRNYLNFMTLRNYLNFMTQRMLSESLGRSFSVSGRPPSRPSPFRVWWVTSLSQPHPFWLSLE
jgi:hypothetical protein